MASLSLPLAADVARSGYAWWYLDVLGDDGHHAATVIFFVGNPFSPFYLRAVRRAEREQRELPAAQGFCAVNAVLYRGRRKLWTFDELCGCERDDERLAIGPSSLTLGERVVADFSTRSPLLGVPLRGRVIVEPARFVDEPHWLDAREQHRWYPMAPHSRARVELDEPALCFEGRAYFDGNRGAEPLTRGFSRWYWMRSPGETSTEVIYDTVDAAGAERRYDRVFGADGSCSAAEASERLALPRTRWLIARETRAGRGERVTRVRTVESAPFYSRAIVELDGAGRRREAMHELMDVDRLRGRLVQAAFYLRMRRARDAGAAPRLGLRTRLLGG
ncbi:MAG: hypothetical protein KC503_10525 [Myxococcales bacterium]|nr:hypothetical protein [Myxococcales bacterium]